MTMNETIMEGAMECGFSFETALEVMTEPIMLVFIGIVWFLPLFLYILVASTVRGRSPNGSVYSKPMICSANFWYPILIWGLLQLGLLVLLVFPFWIRLFP